VLPRRHLSAGAPDCGPAAGIGPPAGGGDTAPLLAVSLAAVIAGSGRKPGRERAGRPAAWLADRPVILCHTPCKSFDKDTGHALLDVSTSFSEVI